MIVMTSLPGFWDWGWLRVPGWFGWGWGAQGRIGWCLTKHTVLVHQQWCIGASTASTLNRSMKLKTYKTLITQLITQMFFSIPAEIASWKWNRLRWLFDEPDTVDNHATWNIEKPLFSLQSIFLSCLPIIVSEVDSDSPEGTSHWRSISASVTLPCFAFVAVAFYPRSSHFELAPLGGKTKNPAADPLCENEFCSSLKALTRN